MHGRTDARGRLVVLLALVFIASGGLFLRTAYWQILRHDDLAADARRQTERTVTTGSRRGTIYDRTGITILATTLDRSRLIASPGRLTPERRAEVARDLIAILGLEGEAAVRLTERMGRDEDYVVLASEIDESDAADIRVQLKERGITAVGFESRRVRSYPIEGGGDGSTSLAANLLGFVNADGDGQYGVEGRYQEELAGLPRVVVAERDAAGRTIYGSERVVEPGSPGSDLTLTIDAELQSAVEEELFAAWVADRAESVSAVVLDPYTGEVYAQASYPSYDANDYRRTADDDPGRFRDPVVSDVYEPGSVFKMLTAAVALELGVVEPGTKVKDTATLVLDDGRARISNSDRRGKGLITFEDGIAYSRNVVAAKVALKLGKTTKAASSALYRTWLRFGFGRPTGIDVAGEEAGLLRDPALRPWRQIDLANGSFGQGLSVTPIQLASAYAAMVNGGTLVRPRVVKAVGATETAPEPGERIMTPDASAEMVELMKRVVTEVPFYRDRMQVPGYVVGGKTGTAQIWDAKRDAWKANTFNFSFIGFIGREAPRLVVAIRINEGRPTVNRPGDISLPVQSFELFRRIGTDAITMLDLPPGTGPQPSTASR